MERTGTNINIAHRIERKLNLQDERNDRLLKQVLLGKTDERIEEEDLKENGQTTVVDRCKKDTCTLYRLAADRTK